jgi:hypothetical protein
VLYFGAYRVVHIIRLGHSKGILSLYDQKACKLSVFLKQRQLGLAS